MFSPIFWQKLAFLTRKKAKLCKILIITLVFEKNAIFSAENCQKSQKIVIITSTPGEEKLTPPILFSRLQKSLRLADSGAQLTELGLS
jgi:hypothetical protein